MAKTLLGWQNVVLEPNLSFDVFGPISQMPPQNLGSSPGSPSLGWQCPVVGAPGSYPLLRFTPSSRRTIGAMGFFRTNLTSSAQVTMQIWTNPGPNLQYNAVVSPVEGVGQVLTFPVNIAGDFCQFLFVDDANPDGFINIPLAYIGPVFNPLSGVSWATNYGRDESPDTVVSRGGQEYVTLKWQRRRLELAFEGLRQSELWSQVDQLRIAARNGINVLAVPDANSAYVQNEAVFGLLQDTADFSYPYGAADRRAYHAKLTERI